MGRWTPPLFTTCAAPSISIPQSPCAVHPHICSSIKYIKSTIQPCSLQVRASWWTFNIIIIMKYAEMGSSISKYDDLELATAEGGLEPLPTGPSTLFIIFYQNDNFHYQEDNLYHHTFYHHKRLSVSSHVFTSVQCHPIVWYILWLVFTIIFIGGRWLRDSPTKLYLKVFFSSIFCSPSWWCRSGRGTLVDEGGLLHLRGGGRRRAATL